MALEFKGLISYLDFTSGISDDKFGVLGWGLAHKAQTPVIPYCRADNCQIITINSEAQVFVMRLSCKNDPQLAKLHS